MTRAVLTATEARAHAEGTLTEIRRPFDEANDSVPADFRARFGGAPDAASAVFPDGSGKGWIAWWTTAPVTAEQTARLYPGEHGIAPPLGQPGTVLDVAEEWGTTSGEDPLRPGCVEIVYRADDDGAEDLCWTPAEDMPAWAVRSRLRITAVRVERAATGWEWVYSVEKAL